MKDVEAFNKVVLNKRGKLNSRALNWEYVKKRLPDICHELHTDISVQDFYYLINMGEPPLCPVCKTGRCIPKKIENTFMFSKYCCGTCSNKDVEYRREHAIKAQANVDKESANAKRRKTMLLKYGREYNSQIETNKHKLGVSNKSPEKKKNISKALKSNHSHIPYEEITIEKIQELNKRESVPSIAKRFGVSNSFIHQYLNRHGFTANTEIFSSYPETLVKDILDEANVEYICNTRQVIGQELDILIPSKNLAIEINGVYWHCESSGNKSKNYHLNKTERCASKGIDLLHFKDIDVLNKQPIVKSIILKRLGLVEEASSRVYRCIEIDGNIAKDFMIKNHLESHVGTNHYGLYLGDELVFVAVAEGDGVIGWCESIHHFDPKIMSAFLVFNEKISRVHVDRRFGSIHSSNLDIVDYTEPDYEIYKQGMDIERLPNKDLWCEFKESGYDRIWDCGKTIYKRC